VERKTYLVKAFTKDKAQGNPAGVVTDADGMTDEEMLSIARDLKFSESAFVQSSDKADYKVRFFSVEEEVPFCGHATVATFHTLVEQGILKFEGKEEIQIKQETKAGILPVFCRKRGFITMVQNNPEFGLIEDDRNLIAKLLSISEKSISDFPIQSVSSASTKLMIPIASLDVLKNINPDLKGIYKYTERTGVRGFYPFTSETLDPESDFFTRQFNPFIGIDEDPITGVAAGALGAYVNKYKLSDKKTFIIEQGYFMGKGGKMYVDVSDGIKVGGFAVTFGYKSYKFKDR
jgi:PhzF family phenazine biosynthesis protein